MTLEEMRSEKERKGYSYEYIARMSGVPLGTVQKVLSGLTKSPRYDTRVALERFFMEESELRTMVRETALSYGSRNPKYGRQGQYTYDDYLQISEEIRVELIDGVIYEMAAPTAIHQLITGEIFYTIREYIKRNKGKCVPFVAPIDVRLGPDDRTVVQPDVLVVCRRDKIKREIKGAPDLVVEVLSPASRRKDIVTKMGLYQSAGTREYWIVDPRDQKVIVYDLVNLSIHHYLFTEQVPVGILAEEGREPCMVDFAEIRNMIEELEESDD